MPCIYKCSILAPLWGAIYWQSTTGGPRGLSFVLIQYLVQRPLVYTRHIFPLHTRHICLTYTRHICLVYTKQICLVNTQICLVNTKHVRLVHYQAYPLYIQGIYALYIQGKYAVADTFVLGPYVLGTFVWAHLFGPIYLGPSVWAHLVWAHLFGSICLGPGPKRTGSAHCVAMALLVVCLVQGAE